MDTCIPNREASRVGVVRRSNGPSPARLFPLLLLLALFLLPSLLKAESPVSRWVPLTPGETETPPEVSVNEVEGGLANAGGDLVKGEIVLA